MRDRPLVYQVSEDSCLVTPGPVGADVSWMRSQVEVPYGDGTVSIRKQLGALVVSWDSEVEPEVRRGVLRATLALADSIYSTTYRNLWDLSQEMLHCYAEPGEAMILGFPRDRCFLAWSESGEQETFCLWSPGSTNSLYRIERKLVRSTEGLIRWLWKLKSVESTDEEQSELHGRLAEDLIEERNRLEAYGWRHRDGRGITVPMGWRFMDEVREA